jgi:hypothetical protein
MALIFKIFCQISTERLICQGGIGIPEKSEDMPRKSLQIQERGYSLAE